MICEKMTWHSMYHSQHKMALNRTSILGPLSPAWLTNCTHWNKISYPFQNFNGGAVEVWELMSNFTPQFTRHVITCPITNVLGYEALMSIKEASGRGMSWRYSSWFRQSMATARINTSITDASRHTNRSPSILRVKLPSNSKCHFSNTFLSAISLVKTRGLIKLSSLNLDVCWQDFIKAIVCLLLRVSFTA